MSNILELLKNEKVEWKTLGEVCEIRVGTSFPKNEQGCILEKYPFYKVADMNKYDIFMYEADNYISENTAKKLRCNPAPKGTIIFPKVGATLYTNKKRILTQESCYDNNIFGLIVNNVNAKYLYYYLLGINLIDLSTGTGAVPSINKSTVYNLKIPIPSLETQEKIVNILDKFTECTTKLCSELNKELKLRIQQYEYYRNMLLSEEYLKKLSEKSDLLGENDFIFTTLGNIVDIVVGGDIPKNNFSYEPTDKYQIPIYSNGIGDKALYGYTDKYRVKEESVTISARGTIGYVSYKNTPYYPIVRLLCLIPKKDIKAKYLYYLLQNMDIKHKETGIPSLTTDMVKNIKISLPPIEVQNKVVEILDKFHTIVHDLKIGLPREIELRQKQYEYYREKLLSFNDKA